MKKMDSNGLKDIIGIIKNIPIAIYVQVFINITLFIGLVIR